MCIGAFNAPSWYDTKLVSGVPQADSDACFKLVRSMHLSQVKFNSVHVQL
jgi:hypothetical protein